MGALIKRNFEGHAFCTITPEADNNTQEMAHAFLTLGVISLLACSVLSHSEELTSMTHIVFATTTTTGLETTYRALIESGYRLDEVSVVAMTPGALPSMHYAPWQRHQRQVFSGGPLAQHFAVQFAATMSLALSTCGLPAYAIRQCENSLDNLGVILAVHVANCFDIESLTELLRDNGSQPIAVVPGLIESLQAA